MCGCTGVPPGLVQHGWKIPTLEWFCFDRNIIQFMGYVSMIFHCHRIFHYFPWGIVSINRIILQPQMWKLTAAFEIFFWTGKSGAWGDVLATRARVHGSNGWPVLGLGHLRDQSGHAHLGESLTKKSSLRQGESGVVSRCLMCNWYSFQFDVFVAICYIYMLYILYTYNISIYILFIWKHEGAAWLSVLCLETTKRKYICRAKSFRMTSLCFRKTVLRGFNGTGCPT